MTKILSMPRDEAEKRVATLRTGILQLLKESEELVDLTLDALLTSYLTIAEQTGRIHEVPTVLSNVAQALANGLNSSQSTTKH